VAQCHKCHMLVEMRKIWETQGYLSNEKQVATNFYASGKYPEASEKIQQILQRYTTVESGSGFTSADPAFAPIKFVPTHADLLALYQMMMNIGVKDRDFIVALRYGKLMTDCSAKGYVKNAVEVRIVFGVLFCDLREVKTDFGFL